MVLSREYLESFVCERFRNDSHYREGHVHILAPAPGTEILGLHTPEMKKIAKLLRGGEQWSVRVGTVLAMCHYLDAGSIIRTFTEIDSIGLQENEPYYIRMGVAWLLATALAKDEERTREFVRGSSLPQDIIKLYVRKARESFRTRNVMAI